MGPRPNGTSGIHFETLLPLRFDYDDNYFSHPYQGMPEDGYTAIVRNILDVHGLETKMNCSFESISDDFDHVFTGPIDRYFNFRIGRLAYRTSILSASSKTAIIRKMQS
jgi:UDP-galactopyranose mutase